jgi:ribA/ribD-fused uncharacterized protein
VLKAGMGPYLLARHRGSAPNTVISNYANPQVNDDALRRLNNMNSHKIWVEGDSMVRHLPLRNTTTVSTSGATIEDLSLRYSKAPPAIGELLIPDIMVILIGTNNVNRSLEMLEPDLHKMMSGMRKWAPFTPILFLAIRIRPRDTQWKLGFENQMTKNRKTINHMIQNATRYHPGIYYKNPYKIETACFEGSRKILVQAFKNDGLHLSVLGKERLSKWILKITEYELHHVISQTKLITMRYVATHKHHIVLFHGEKAFLSNFHACEINIFGHSFHSAEGAYQYAKALSENRRDIASQCSTLHSGRDIKRLIRQSGINGGHKWDGIKSQIMTLIIIEKFGQNSNLNRQLRDTGKAPLQEDTNNIFWARKNGNGQNELGAILTQYRESMNNPCIINALKLRAANDIMQLHPTLNRKLNIIILNISQSLQ